MEKSTKFTFQLRTVKKKTKNELKSKSELHEQMNKYIITSSCNTISQKTNKNVVVHFS